MQIFHAFLGAPSNPQSITTVVVPKKGSTYSGPKPYKYCSIVFLRVLPQPIRPKGINDYRCILQMIVKIFFLVLIGNMLLRL